MDQHQTRNQQQPLSILVAFPFRPFFLSAALAAALLVPLWLWIWTRGGGNLALPPLFWHQHEMLAGFVNAAVAGFLLTAVCNWTRTPPVAGWRLLGLWLVWFAGRLGMALGGDVAPLAELVDLAFMPIVAISVGWRVWVARQRRQLVLLLVLAAFWGLDLLFHWTGDVRFLHALVMLTALLILVIGGRITPAFTANWLRGHGGDPAQVVVRLKLDNVGLVLAAVLVVLEITAIDIPIVTAVVAILAGLVVVVRLQGWLGWEVRREPLLWILYLGHLWVAFGFVLRGLAALSMVPGTTWLHALGAGAMGTMILGVMTRVSVGHTGRPMELYSGGLWAYGLILFAGAVRVLSALGWVPLMSSLWLAALTWSAAWLIFLVVYGPILVAPRADGKPG